MGQAEAEREQYLKDKMKDRFGSPEVSEVKWQGVDDPEQKLTVTFQMKIPGYLQRTGRRLFIQPAIFHRNLAARFPNAKREHPVVFSFPWSEFDAFTFTLPEGYELETPSLPAPVTANQTLGWEMGGVAEGRTLRFERKFFLGEDRAISFGAPVYPTLKQAFDVIQQGDQMSFALRQAAAK